MINIYLLDSSVFVWSIWDSKRIGQKCSSVLQQPNSEVFVSVVSLWELMLKHKKGKFKYSFNDLIEAVSLSGIKLLNLEVNHLEYFNKLSHTHKDPFDTILYSQAVSEDMSFVTSDKIMINEFEDVINARQ